MLLNWVERNLNLGKKRDLKVEAEQSDHYARRMKSDSR